MQAGSTAMRLLPANQSSLLCRPTCIARKALTASGAAVAPDMPQRYFAANCVEETKLFTCANSGRVDCAPLPVDFSSAA